MTATSYPAEPITTLNGPRGHSVTIRREYVPVGHFQQIRRAYVVTTDTGYRAVLPECLRGDCADGTYKPCALPYGHGKSVKGADGCDGSNGIRNGRCHAWHEPSAERFAAEVLATYKYRLPKVPKGGHRDSSRRPALAADPTREAWAR